MDNVKDEALDVKQEESQDDRDVTIKAQQELLAENKLQLEKLVEEIKDLKLSNQKMALKIGLEKEVTDEDLFKGFSKYD